MKDQKNCKACCHSWETSTNLTMYCKIRISEGGKYRTSPYGTLTDYKSAVLLDNSVDYRQPHQAQSNV